MILQIVVCAVVAYASPVLLHVYALRIYVVCLWHSALRLAPYLSSSAKLFMRNVISTGQNPKTLALQTVVQVTCAGSHATRPGRYLFH